MRAHVGGSVSPRKAAARWEGGSHPWHVFRTPGPFFDSGSCFPNAIGSLRDACLAWSFIRVLCGNAAPLPVLFSVFSALHCCSHLLSSPTACEAQIQQVHARGCKPVSISISTCHPTRCRRERWAHAYSSPACWALSCGHNGWKGAGVTLQRALRIALSNRTHWQVDRAG